MKKIFLLLLLCTPALYSLEIDPGIAEGIDLQSLQTEARRISFSIDKFKENENPYLYAISDYHRVFDLEMESVITVLTDLDNGERVFSRIIDTIDLEPDKSAALPHRQYVHNRVSLFGISEEYIYTILITVEKHTETECLIYWKLENCELGNITAHEGCWYLKRLDSPENSPLTYVRMKADTLFINPIPFQELVMKLLTDGETKKMFAELYRAAGK